MVNIVIRYLLFSEIYYQLLTINFVLLFDKIFGQSNPFTTGTGTEILRTTVDEKKGIEITLTGCHLTDQCGFLILG